LSVSDQPLPCTGCYDGDGLRHKTHQWTPMEDVRLLAGVHKFGADNWSTIARFVGSNRTRSQCSQRWQRGLDPRISRSHWTKQEETTLMELVAKYGTKSWTVVSRELRNRSDVQCRYRYMQLERESHGAASFQPPRPEIPLPRLNEPSNPAGPHLFDPLLWDNDDSLGMKTSCFMWQTGTSFGDYYWSLD
jgi:hypothetical protein